MRASIHGTASALSASNTTDANARADQTRVSVSKLPAVLAQVVSCIRNPARDSPSLGARPRITGRDRPRRLDAIRRRARRKDRSNSSAIARIFARTKAASAPPCTAAADRVLLGRALGTARAIDRRAHGVATQGVGLTVRYRQLIACAPIACPPAKATLPRQAGPPEACVSMLHGTSAAAVQVRSVRAARPRLRPSARSSAARGQSRTDRR